MRADRCAFYLLDWTADRTCFKRGWRAWRRCNWAMVGAVLAFQFGCHYLFTSCEFRHCPDDDRDRRLCVFHQLCDARKCARHHFLGTAKAEHEAARGLLLLRRTFDVSQRSGRLRNRLQRRRILFHLKARAAVQRFSPQPCLGNSVICGGSGHLVHSDGDEAWIDLRRPIHHSASFRKIRKQQVSPPWPNLFLSTCSYWPCVALDARFGRRDPFGATLDLARSKPRGSVAGVYIDLADFANCLFFFFRIEINWLHFASPACHRLARR